MPGRTDNEIKNIWHTYLKKKLASDNSTVAQKRNTKKTKKQKAETTNFDSNPNTPQPESISSLSSLSTDQSYSDDKEESFVSEEDVILPQMDESFWTEMFSMDNGTSSSSDQSLDSTAGDASGYTFGDQYSIEDDKEFWLKVLCEAGGVMDMSQL